MNYIDLHIHSNHSDGSNSPSEIVKLAKEKQLKLIALTDHNTLSGINDFRLACIESKQPALAGIEISTSYDGKEIHLLGYFNLFSDFNDSKFDALKQLIKDYKNIKITQNNNILNKFIAVCPQASLDDFYNFASKLSGSGNYNRVHIAKYMVAKGYVTTIDEAFDKYLDKTCLFYVPKSTISLKKAITAIHQAKGTAIIAHLGEYNFNKKMIISFIDDCIKYGVDGFECYHPLNTIEQIELLHQYPTMLLTAGSDYHGTNKKNNFLGQSCNTQLDCCHKNQYFLDIEIAYQYLRESKYIQWEGFFPDKDFTFAANKLLKHPQYPHITTQYMPEKPNYKYYGKTVDVVVAGYLYDDQVKNSQNKEYSTIECLIVESITCDDESFNTYLGTLQQKFHFTLSYSHKAVDCNHADFSKIKPLNLRLKMTFGGYNCKINKPILF